MGMVIAGFGMSIVLQNVAFLIWGARRAVSGDFRHAARDRQSDAADVVCVDRRRHHRADVELARFLRKTMLGLAIRAVAYNKDIAYLSGVNVR